MRRSATMKSYFELRRQLAREYPTAAEWRAASEDSGLEPSGIILQGASITAWSNIFDAIRKTGRVDGLRVFLAREQPRLLPLFEDYAAALARGEAVQLDLLELESVALGKDELTPDSVRRSLDSARPLSEELLRVTLQGEASRSAIDSVLTGGNTAGAQRRLREFKDQLALGLSKLSSLRREVASQLSDVEKQIRDIQSARRPDMPIAPPPNPALSAAEQGYNQKHYAD